MSLLFFLGVEISSSCRTLPQRPAYSPLRARLRKRYYKTTLFYGSRTDVSRFFFLRGTTPQQSELNPPLLTGIDIYLRCQSAVSFPLTSSDAGNDHSAIIPRTLSRLFFLTHMVFCCSDWFNRFPPPFPSRTPSTCPLPK